MTFKPSYRFNFLALVLLPLVSCGVNAAIRSERIVRFEDVVLPDLPGRIVPRVNFVSDVLAGASCTTEESLRAFLNSGSKIEFLSSFNEFAKSDLVGLDGDNLVLKKALSLSPWSWLGSDENSYQCGVFEQCSVQELQNRCRGLAFPGGGTFNVVEGIGTAWDSWFRRYVDVGALQADSDNADAVFQVASNFNGLETVNAQQNIETQLLQEYINDMTQGPAASISAAPGLLARRYFTFYDPNWPVDAWQQTIANPVNFLDDLAHVLPVSRAGYVVFAQSPQAPDANDYCAMKIGFHRDVQVTHGYMVDRNNHLFIVDAGQPQIINQVFTAALDLGVTNRAYRNDTNVQVWAKQILNAAYEGTLRAAFAAGKRRVFLTLVGGGVFENNLMWIFDAINRMKDFIKDSGLEVTLIKYSGDLMHASDQLRNRFLKLVEEADGEYIQYRNDGKYRCTIQE